MAVGLITGGRLGDIFGRKRMFLIGAAGFTVGSLLCGIAQSPRCSSEHVSCRVCSAR
nr:hypothetical protein GCM10020093_055720 [Planobispora longispora]